jgi:predicted phosphodiesterase
MTIIGDTHADYTEYLKITSNCSESIQVGDFGMIGFTDKVPYLGLNHKFIRGNHDDPMLCKQHPNYLGDYGIYKNIFYMSGAHSIDLQTRTPGLDWWPDEELSMKELYDAYTLYATLYPPIVITHDAPYTALIAMGVFDAQSRTNEILEQMFEMHKPKLWVYGHHHRSFQEDIEKTKFICLNIDERLEI